MKDIAHPGTAQNKSSNLSMLMCRSYLGGEPLPIIHPIFTSDAVEDENFLVNAKWFLNISCIFVLFGLSMRGR